MAYYEKIFLHLPEAAFISDEAHVIQAMNIKAEEILGATAAACLGRLLTELLPAPQLENLLDEAVLYHRTPQLSYENSVIHFENQEKKRYYKIAVVPFLDYEGLLQRVLTTLTDVTILKEVEQLKTDFFAAASHEFRTPLTSIMMGVGMVRQQKLGDLSPRGLEIMEAIEDDCARLLRLTENMLELSRMDTGAITMELESASIYRIVEAALGTLELQAEKKKVKLFTSLPTDLPQVKADLNKIIWVITNLVGNALRYTAEGGSITVKAIRKGGEVFFSVADTGKGIPARDHEKIFQKFVQLEDDTSAKGGAGLGLAICKDIIEAHGGRIRVRSEPGKGTTFTFSLPVA